MATMKKVRCNVFRLVVTEETDRLILISGNDDRFRCSFARNNWSDVQFRLPCNLRFFVLLRDQMRLERVVSREGLTEDVRSKYEQVQQLHSYLQGWHLCSPEGSVTAATA